MFISISSLVFMTRYSTANVQQNGTYFTTIPFPLSYLFILFSLITSIYELHLKNIYRYQYFILIMFIF